MVTTYQQASSRLQNFTCRCRISKNEWPNYALRSKTGFVPFGCKWSSLYCRFIRILVTRQHWYTQNVTNTHTHTKAHTHMHTHKTHITHTHAQTLTHTHTHIHTHTRSGHIHTHTHTNRHAYAHTHKHAHAQTLAHTHTHTHTHIYIYISLQARRETHSMKSQRGEQRRRWNLIVSRWRHARLRLYR